MLILILIDVQYSQNTVFSYKKFSNRQNHYPSGSHHLVKNAPGSVYYILTQSHGTPKILREKEQELCIET